jgi:hypothetical protein
MKRLLLLSALSLLALGVAAGPALAWYHMEPKTAYITTFQAKGWDEWAGPTDPLNGIHHDGAVPHGWKVALGWTWLDSQTGARLAPAEFLNTFSFAKKGGSWSKEIGDPAKAARFWSPLYEWDAATMPGVYGEDWYVSFGKLAKGTYTGWSKTITLAPYPTWVDDNGKILSEPVWVPKETTRVAHTFTVK